MPPPVEQQNPSQITPSASSVKHKSRLWVWITSLILLFLIVAVAFFAFLYLHLNSNGLQRQAYFKAITPPQENIAVPSNAQAFEEGGYSINIPADFSYSRADLGPTIHSDIWQSPNLDQMITVEWEPYTPGTYSYIKSTEDAQFQVNELAKTKPQITPYAISYPNVSGAASSTLFEKPINPGSRGMYLFVIGNGNIYEVTGLSEAPGADALVKEVVESFSLH